MTKAEERFGKARDIVMKAKAQMKKDAPAVFKAGIKDLFARYPDLKDISFTAYTPYFNDGDACEYELNTHSPDINCACNYTDVDEDEDDCEVGEENGEKKEQDDEFRGVYVTRKPNKKAHWSEHAAWDFYCLSDYIGEDYFQTEYGDGVRVIIFKNKIEVQEYSHD